MKKISKDFYSAFVDFDQPLYAAMAIFVRLSSYEGNQRILTLQPQNQGFIRFHQILSVVPEKSKLQCD